MTTQQRRRRTVAAVYRAFLGMVTLLILPPFVMVAVAPTIFYLVPVAIVGLPFLAWVLTTAKHERTRRVVHRQAALRHAHP